MVKYKLKLGNGTIEAECQDMKSAHRFGAVYGGIPQKCHECGSEDIYLSFKSPSGNDYYIIQCKKCGAEFTLHQYKNGGFFIKPDDRFKKYVPPEGTQKTEKFEDDIPEGIF